jgi:hypothetical protein
VSFSNSELRALRALKTPAGIQRFIDDMPYHLGATAWSPRRVLRERTAHCLEAALFGAAALRVIAVYREHGAWGAIGASNYASCRGRQPVYRTLRELALSYFEGYFNLRRQRTLRRFSRPINLARFDEQGWMTSEKSVWFIVDHLFEVQHFDLLTPKMRRALDRVDERSFRAGLHGHRRL